LVEIKWPLPLHSRSKNGEWELDKTGCHPEQSEGQKIFESWETIALYSDSHRNKIIGKSSEIHFDLTR